MNEDLELWRQHHKLKPLTFNNKTEHDEIYAAPVWWRKRLLSRYTVWERQYCFWCERDSPSVSYWYQPGFYLVLDRRWNQLYITANRRTSVLIWTRAVTDSLLRLLSRIPWFVRGVFFFHLTTWFSVCRNHTQSQWHCGNNSYFRVENWCCSALSDSSSARFMLC